MHVLQKAHDTYHHTSSWVLKGTYSVTSSDRRILSSISDQIIFPNHVQLIPFCYYERLLQPPESAMAHTLIFL